MKSTGFTLEYEKVSYWVDIQDSRLEVYNTIINGMAYGLVASAGVGDQGFTYINVLKDFPEVIWEVIRDQVGLIDHKCATHSPAFGVLET